MHRECQDDGEHSPSDRGTEHNRPFSRRGVCGQKRFCHIVRCQPPAENLRRAIELAPIIPGSPRFEPGQPPVEFVRGVDLAAQSFP